MSSVSESLRKIGGLVPASGGARAAPSLMSVPGVRIGANILIRLEVAMRIMKHYRMVNLKKKQVS